MALFLAGTAFGLFLYRTYVEYVRGTTELNRCDICKYAGDCAERRQKKDRETRS